MTFWGDEFDRVGGDRAVECHGHLMLKQFSCL